MKTETNLERFERCLREEEEKLKAEISRLPIIKAENVELHEKLRKSEELLRKNEMQLDQANQEVRRLRKVVYEIKGKTKSSCLSCEEVWGFANDALKGESD